MIKVLVVDDSALMRKHLRDILIAEGDIEVEVARNGREALERAAAFAPDVITLDVTMPEMDGLTCLRRLMAVEPRPVVMVSALTEEGAQVTLDALRLGAVDFLSKPEGTVPLDLDGLRVTLVAKVRTAARVRLSRSRGLLDRVRQRHQAGKPDWRTGTAPVRPAPVRRTANGLVLIGVSTGGPRALEEILPALPPEFPWPVLVAQHMPATFTNVFARRIDKLSALSVVEVSQPMPLLPGRIHIAQGDADVIVTRRIGRLIAEPVPMDEKRPWHPSTDRMVESALAMMDPRDLVGVLLTGMGNDGAAAMTRLYREGGRTLAESESTAVVFGMPGELVRLGGAGMVVPCGGVARQLINWLM
ncbi:MAG TPA: chemotaxis-specific protein-glutamate methyltransferase CheB [Azospirillaceae bacterium]|nr:chemotaxis-specific protein-glutamate methyltransferase CheB [Azospirillaceae bacterium]